MSEKNNEPEMTAEERAAEVVRIYFETQDNRTMSELVAEALTSHAAEAVAAKEAEIARLKEQCSCETCGGVFECLECGGSIYTAKQARSDLAASQATIAEKERLLALSAFYGDDQGSEEIRALMAELDRANKERGEEAFKRRKNKTNFRIELDKQRATIAELREELAGTQGNLTVFEVGARRREERIAALEADKAALVKEYSIRVALLNERALASGEEMSRLESECAALRAQNRALVELLQSGRNLAENALSTGKPGLFMPEFIARVAALAQFPTISTSEEVRALLCGKCSHPIDVCRCGERGQQPISEEPLIPQAECKHPFRKFVQSASGNESWYECTICGTTEEDGK